MNSFHSKKVRKLLLRILGVPRSVVGIGARLFGKSWEVSDSLNLLIYEQ